MRSRLLFLLHLTLGLGGCGLDLPKPPSAPVDNDGDGYYPGIGPISDCDDSDQLIHPGAAERCNGLDDDCDGQTDEDLVPPLVVGKRGVCARRVQVCAGTDGWQEPDDATASGYEAVEASCDGRDNDCDGETDEQLVQDCYGGPPGTFGVGRCKGGQQACLDGQWGACIGEVQPAPEVCNGLDDDCDGQTDEDLAPPAADKTLSVCAGSIKVCAGVDGWQEPDYDLVPDYQTVEVTCDGIDNDCDGETDEFTMRPFNRDADQDGYGNPDDTVSACDPPVGYVGDDYDCDDLDPAVHPDTVERCNDLDDDCDGQTDEQLVQDCYDGPAATAGVGLCQAGQSTCIRGQWGVCVGEVRPSAESCNDKDDDCDGQTDNGVAEACYAGPQGTRGKGGCQDGIRACTHGQWGGCQGEVLPANERCNGLDDDCDDKTDEGFTLIDAAGVPRQQGDPCAGRGVCPPGHVECDAAGIAAVCSTFPAGSDDRSSPESCDGLDDDCDGQTDEEVLSGVGDACLALGVCAGTLPVCRAALGWRCEYPVTHQETETLCDGLDNDCDGLTDLDDSDVRAIQPQAQVQDGVCHGARKSCAGPGGWQEPNHRRLPGFEEQEASCDGLDNDCDGLTDLGDPDLQGARPQATRHVGVCTGSKQACPGAAGWAEPDYGLLSGYEATEQSCDGRDNDCDGETDEDLAPPPADRTVGACAGSRMVCRGAAGWQEPDYKQIAGYEPAEQSCDGLDNDCDGVTDLDDAEVQVSQPPASLHVGVCTGLKQVCAGAAGWGEPDYLLAAGPSYEAEETSCDGLDNDCDGSTDEGCPCSAGETRPCSVGVGICATGTQSCEDWAWGLCLGAVQPRQETYNGLDDDCDGETDEGCRCGDDVCPPHPLGWRSECNPQQHCEYRPDGGTWEEEQQAEIWVAPGSFLMGSPEGEDGRDANEGPVHQVTFAHGYFIGKYEVTAARYESCQAHNSVGCTEPSTVDGDGNGWGLNRTANSRADHPQNGVTKDQARAFCCWIGGRLPSEAEWEYSASGPEHRRFPWGAMAADCSHAIYDQDGDGTRPWGCEACSNVSCSATKPVGSVPAGAAWSSAQDVAGNVWEWVDDCWHDDYTGSPRDGSSWKVPCGANAVLRGGGFNGSSLVLRSAYRDINSPTDRHVLIGVRCARDPLPETCNGQDDDGDGQTDEGCNGCPPGTVVPRGWVCVPAGSFVMGSPGPECDAGCTCGDGPGQCMDPRCGPAGCVAEDCSCPGPEAGRFDDEVQHEVTLTRHLLAQATEVTHAQWWDVMGTALWYFDACGSGCPMEQVSWHQAIAYCNALSLREGLESCFKKAGGADYDAVAALAEEEPSWPPGLDCLGYRLPSEAEWEHATRAGSLTAFYSGAITHADWDCGDDPNLDLAGWYCGSDGVEYSGCYDASSFGGPVCAGPHPVSFKEPNGWGLHDVLGNVWEWCWDWYDAYPAGPLEDPTGTTPAPPRRRVIRGGAWGNAAFCTRTAFRGDSNPSLYPSSWVVGFRPVRTVPAQSSQ